MKLKKIVGILIILLTLILTYGLTNSYAANPKYILGITNVREPANGKLGGAYKFEVNTTSATSKKIWKIVSYDTKDSTIINYDNAFYCIKAEHGFATNGNTDVSTVRKEYDTSFNMKTQKAEVMTRLNDINVFKTDTSSYNKVMWIIDNMYLPKQQTTAQRDVLLTAAEIIGPNGYADGLLLTDDDIEVVQQMAIWYFTNSDNAIYHRTQLPTLLFNNWSGQDSNYLSFEDLYNDPIANTDLGLKRQYQAEDLYKYFIENAEQNANYVSNDEVSPLELDKSRVTIIEEGANYKAGPYRINKKSDLPYTINELKFKDENGNDVTVNLQDASGNPISGIILNSDFYITIPTTTSIKSLTFNISITYSSTEATYYTTSVSTYKDEQPVVLVEKTTPEYKDSITVTIPAPKAFDLALRKSITKLNNVAPAVNRLPQVDVTNLANGTETTATYNHPKDTLLAEINQEIEYTFTIYNEGDKDGYAAEIKDYLPAGIEFVELVSDKTKYTAQATKNSDGTTTVTITNIGKNVLEKYDNGDSLDSEQVTIKCKITKTPQTENVRLVNVAEITKYFDSELNNLVNTDRDSQIENFPQELFNSEYEGKEKQGNYVKGQQDDDDFEAVLLLGKEFDLALRKFVTQINGRDTKTDREPVVDITKLANGTETTATYNHSKVPLSVSVGDIVTYTIRVYNEGTIDGYASEITDHLPPQLEFLPDDDTNISNGWVYDENDVQLRTIKTNHLSKEIDEDNLIKAFDGKKLDYKDVTVKCKVKSNVESSEKITNIAEITDFRDSQNATIIDRDSEKGNVILPSDEELPNYKDEEIARGDTYIPGQQDDDDFEKLKVQIFDLALRKFITKVDDTVVTNRIPQLSMGEDGNIKYTHTKEPVEVRTNNVVTYTLRIFNEGDISGYASEITDNLPEGLEFLPDNATNKQYRWIMIDEDGNQTTDVSKAVKVTTDYLSKDQEKIKGLNLLKAFDKEQGITANNPDYRDIKIAFKVIEPNTSSRILINTAEISDDTDKDGNPINDIDSTPGNNKEGEDDIDIEKVKLVYFDLALRKFITKVNDEEITNRIPQLSMGEDGNIKYTHTKEPVVVQNKDMVTYTLRVFNEGKISGYATEVTDDLPEGLEFLPDNATNKQYRWVMIDEEGNQTTDVSKAVKVTTDYLSKEQEKNLGENLIKAFNKELGITDNNPDYRDLKIVFKVTEPNTSDRILINTAEISEDSDENGKPVDDIDSTPNNNKEGEDDIDIEKVRVKYFDLSLKKWVTQAIVIEDGKQNITETGHTGDENPEPIVKVDLKSKNINKVTVKFRYKIKVTNEGEIEGYVKEIKDYIPEGLEFDAADNPLWEEVSANVVKTKQLENTLLKPGESATVEILLTWINSQDNMGLKVNVAEISKDYNESETPDIDSTPDNQKPGEDDIDDAPVILSVKTGEVQVYIGLTTIVLVTLAGGVFLIKRFVL